MVSIVIFCCGILYLDFMILETLTQSYTQKKGGILYFELRDPNSQTQREKVSFFYIFVFNSGTLTQSNTVRKAGIISNTDWGKAGSGWTGSAT